MPMKTSTTYEFIATDGTVTVAPVKSGVRVSVEGEPVLSMDDAQELAKALKKLTQPNGQ